MTLINVLIVEDEKALHTKINNKYFQGLRLNTSPNKSNFEYNFIAVYTAYDGLKYLVNHAVDIVIVDLKLPDSDELDGGLTFLQDINCLGKDVGKIVYSNYVGGIARKLLKELVYAYVEKTTDSDEDLELIEAEIADYLRFRNTVKNNSGGKLEMLHDGSTRLTWYDYSGQLKSISF